MGYDYRKLCPYYDGAIDASWELKNGYTRFRFNVQCNGLKLPIASYDWRECNNHNHRKCPQYQFMRICEKYGKEKK